MLQWAVDRARMPIAEVRDRFPHFDDWLAGRTLPTLKQLETFAGATHAAIGFFFGGEPPEEPLPIPDYRTLGGQGVVRPSPDLLDTIYLCQQRQAWYRDFALTTGEAHPDFVGSLSRQAPTGPAATRIREALRFEVDQRVQTSRLDEALRQFIALVEDSGVLVMVSGVVGSNNTRKLDVEEFRGFALADPVTPLIFINGADSKSGQMFTLAHELAHVWLGESALTDATARPPGNGQTERFCNAVAAEVLVPLRQIRQSYHAAAGVEPEMHRLARTFKVSTLVILRRLLDLGALSDAEFRVAYDAEVRRLQSLERSDTGGGNFYNTTLARVGKRFASAIIGTTLEGRGSFSEAFQLLGFKKMSVLDELGRRVGVTG
jgi:Zn-dependent peptidase ImmA (M78 family)